MRRSLPAVLNTSGISSSRFLENGLQKAFWVFLHHPSAKVREAIALPKDQLAKQRVGKEEKEEKGRKRREGKKKKRREDKEKKER